MGGVPPEAGRGVSGRCPKGRRGQRLLGCPFSSPYVVDPGFDGPDGLWVLQGYLAVGEPENRETEGLEIASSLGLVPELV